MRDEGYSGRQFTVKVRRSAIREMSGSGLLSTQNVLQNMRCDRKQFLAFATRHRIPFSPRNKINLERKHGNTEMCPAVRGSGLNKC
ncbi:hypothetical protein L596_027527 [Steinernema carpocapsae]|uniref:Uncharacterized protein n=1 Tax=Steinernema carpocapsae TaxID=34508 RepID=A0A4U5LVR3_STECR|nr:hypothetical protein L596_027527 [Steinernema carpocapsae]